MAKQLASISVVADTKRMTKHLNETQRKTVPLVTMRALNTAMARYKTAASRQLAGSTGIKVGIIKGRLKTRKANKARLTANVNALLLRVLSRHLGKPRETKSGAKVGKFQFPGAFVETMPRGGKELALKRKGNARLPIQEQGVVIDPPFRSVMGATQRSTATPTFLKEFQRLLKAKFK